MKNTPAITVWNDHEAASIAAAHHFVILCRQAIAKRGKFTVALSGGNTPKRLFELLASEAFSQNIPWKNVYLFWGDERFVSPTDADSNYRMARETLLDKINIPQENIFPVPTEGKPASAAKKYERKIQSYWSNKKTSFDCILLGIGTDGHTASLFPGTSILKEKKRLIREVWVAEKKTWRISFTLPLINNAANIVFLVTGKDKAPIFRQIVTEGKKKSLLPVQLVNPAKGTILWILDKAVVSGI